MGRVLVRAWKNEDWMESVLVCKGVPAQYGRYGFRSGYLAG